MTTSPLASLNDPTLLKTDGLIDGQWVSGGSWFAVHDPATGHHLADVANLDADHAQAAIEPLEPNSWREMRTNTHAAKWQLACDEEMDSLRKLNCWQVVPLSSVLPGTPIMGSRRTFEAKTDQHGGITRLRTRFVC
jgi:hypothetical protein